MSHLTDEQLGAHLDGANRGADAAACEAHLAACAECRERLAALSALDASLAGALEHDPGEAYFASFAGRVAERIASEAAPVAAAAAPRVVSPRRGLFAWWNSPRALAWAGAAAALLVVGAVALVMTRENGTRNYMASKSAPQAVQGEGVPLAAQPQAAPGAPAPSGEAAGAREPAAAAAPAAPSTASPTFAAPPAAGTRNAPASGAAANAARALRATDGLAPSQGSATPARQERAPAARPLMASERVVQVRTLPNGEQEAVNPPTLPQGYAVPPIRTPSGLVKPSASPMAGAPSADRRGAQKSSFAPQSESANAQSLAGAAAPAAEPAMPQLASGGAQRVMADEAAPGAGARLCGVVRDARGRAVAGATVSIAETGASVTADVAGEWCLDAPVQGGTLQVFAVGFQPYRAAVGASQLQASYLATLQAVDALRGGRAGAAMQTWSATPSRDAAPAWAKAKSVALKATADAARAKSVAAWQHASAAWTQALAAAASPAAANEARFSLARGDVSAWRLGGTREQKATARTSVDAYLAGVPSGPLHDLAESWKRELAQ